MGRQPTKPAEKKRAKQPGKTARLKSAKRPGVHRRDGQRLPRPSGGGEMAAKDGANAVLGPAEAALRASEEKYRSLFLNMSEEVHFWRVVHDERGGAVAWRLVDANPPA